MQEQEKLDYSLKLLAKSSIIVFIGLILSKIATYLYKIIVARNFGQEVYGLFSLASLLAGLFVAIFSFGLQSGLLRYISFFRGKEQTEKIKHIFRFSIRFTLPIGILSGILFFIFADTISISIFHNPNLSIFLKWFSLFIPISLLGGLFHVTLRAYEKIAWYSFIGNILLNFTQLIFLVILLFLNLNNSAIILSYNIGMFSILVASFLVCKYKIPEIFKKSTIKLIEGKKLIRDLFSYSWPIMFLGLVTVLFSSVSSFFLGYFKTASEVGIYNVAFTIMELLGVVPALFLQLLFPLITREYSKGNNTLIRELTKQIGKWIFTLNLPFIILVILFPEAIINVLFGSSFISAKIPLRFIAIGLFFYYLFVISENLLSMAGKSKTTLLNFSIASVINIILNLILIPKYGVTGAAISTMISYVLWSILSFFSAKKYTSIVPLKIEMIKILLVSLIPVSIVFLIRKFIEIKTITAVFLGIFFVLLYFFLILVTKCFDENDFIILKSIKNKIFYKKNVSNKI